MTRSDKEYWSAHNVFESRYTQQQGIVLFSHAIPSIDDAINFCERLKDAKFEQRMTEMQKRLLSSQGSPEERKNSFVESIVSLIRWLPLISSNGQAQSSPNSLTSVLMGGASWDMKNVQSTVKIYVSVLDSYARRALGSFSPVPEKFHDLYELVLEEKRVGGSKYDALVWACASNNNVLYQAIAVAALINGQKDFAESIASLTRGNERAIHKYQKLSEKDRESRELLAQSGEQARNSLRLKGEELTALEKVCDKKEEQIKELNVQVEKLSRGSTPSKELSERVEILEAELEILRDEKRKLEDNAQSWKDLAEGEERNVERLRGTVSELWNVVHGDDSVVEDKNKSEKQSRRDVYESRFQQVGLDYSIVDAIIMAGLKGGKFVGECYLPVRHVKTNVFCRLKNPDQVELVDSTLKELVRANVVSIKKNDTALSINPHVKDISIVPLREYIVEVLTEARQLRTGKAVKSDE